MENFITVKHLTKAYKLYKQPIDRLKESLSPTKKKYHKDFLANNDISFEIKKGEVVGIIGRNGSGKSTLLKMITGVLTPTSGSIHINGKITALLELGAGFNPEMTGLENLYLSGSISGLSQRKMQEKIDEIVEFAEIGEFIHQPLKTYSSGMKARLGFAFAINVDPEILIVDEALSVGDAAFQRKCYAKIESMCSSKEITVLFVSHSGGVIKQLCDRALLLHSGKLILDGDPKNIINIYEKFIGSKDTDINKLLHEYTLLINNQNKPKKEKPILQSYYNPNIKSKSIVCYEENGAKISNIRLLDENGNTVNIIEKDSEYTYIYEVDFSQDFIDIKFNMRIKNIKGIVITGHTQAINKVKKGSHHIIKFKFKNILNSGEYFFNSGINAKIYGEQTRLHRIVDAYMIKVINNDNDNSREIVDFHFLCDIVDLTQ